MGRHSWGVKMLRITLLLCVLLGILANAANNSTIGEAKLLSDGTPVAISGSVTSLEPAECYIESTDRSSGIRVQADMTGFALHDLVAATGTLGTLDGERVVWGATVAAAGGSSAIAPLGLRNNWLGGFCSLGGASIQDYRPYHIEGDGTGRRWETVHGAPNTGLLVTTWGTVNAIYYSPITDAHWFYIDDGSGVVSDYGDNGIIVYCDADVHQGDFVCVTGVSSTEVSFDDPTRLVRSIRPRAADDVRVLKAAPSGAICPFSDEFDQAELDDTWYLYGNGSFLSLTSDPGWLALSVDPATGHSPSLFQCLGGDCDIEMKVCPQVYSGTGTDARFYVHWGPSGVVESWFLRYPGSSVASFRRPVPDDPPKASCWLFNSQAPLPSAEVFWLRFRVRGRTALASASTDGVNYCAETGGDWTMPGIRIWATTPTSRAAHTSLVDYVRFTPAID